MRSNELVRAAGTGTAADADADAGGLTGDVIAGEGVLDLDLERDLDRDSETSPRSLSLPSRPPNLLLDFTSLESLLRLLVTAPPVTSGLPGESPSGDPLFLPDFVLLLAKSSPKSGPPK